MSRVLALTASGRVSKLKVYDVPQNHLQNIKSLVIIQMALEKHRKTPGLS